MSRKTQLIMAWTIWLLSAFFMCYKYGIEVSPSVMNDHLMNEFHIDGAQLGNLAACFFYAYLIMQIPAGLLIDRFGPRKITTLAIAICALGGIIFGFSQTLFLAQLGRFLAGLGGAFAAINSLKLIANWFPSRQFALMAGLMMSVAMLGAVSGQAPLSAFLDWLGWRQAMLIIGCFGLVLSAIFWIVVKDHRKYKLTDISFTPKNTNIWQSCKTVFTSGQSWLLSIYSGFAFAPITVFGGLWGVAFLSTAFDLSKTTAAQICSLIFIGFAVGAPLWGWLSDLIGNRKKAMYLGTFCALICFWAILYATPPLWLLSTCMFLAGFFLSSFLLCFTMIREINAPTVAATAIGFMNAFDALLGALSDPLTGKFLDASWDGKMVGGARIFSTLAYQSALCTILVYLAIAFVFLFFIKETYCKSSYPSTIP